MKTNFTIQKQFLKIAFFVFFIINISTAQVVQMATNIDIPADMEIKGDDMYVTEFNTGKILKIDLTQGFPITPVEIASGFPSCTGLALKGDELFIAYESGISKIDITQAAPISSTLVIDDLLYTSQLAFSGDNLFFIQGGYGKISMIDISQPQPTKIDVVTGLGNPYGLELVGNDLFFTELDNAGNGSRIAKVDITEPFPISNIIEVKNFAEGINPTGILKSGNDLFICEFSGNKISKIDLSQPFPATTMEVILGYSNPQFAALSGDQFYFSHSGQTISKLEITVNNIELTPLDLEIFPNPTSGKINFEGIKLDQIEMVDVNGRVVFLDKQPNVSIDISAYPNGIYFLKIKVGEREIMKRMVKK